VAEKAWIDIDCPYCETPNTVDVRQPVDHDLMVECYGCTGTYIARVAVRVEALHRLKVDGEQDRADEYRAHLSRLAERRP